MGDTQVRLVEQLAVRCARDGDEGPGGGDRINEGLRALDGHGVELADEDDGRYGDAVQAGGDTPVHEDTAQRELALALHAVVDCGVHAFDTVEVAVGARDDAACEVLSEDIVEQLICRTVKGLFVRQLAKEILCKSWHSGDYIPPLCANVKVPIGKCTVKHQPQQPMWMCDSCFLCDDSSPTRAIYIIQVQIVVPYDGIEFLDIVVDCQKPRGSGIRIFND